MGLIVLLGATAGFLLGMGFLLRVLVGLEQALDRSDRSLPAESSMASRLEAARSSTGVAPR